ncbi:MAG: hypothetical protein IPN42_06310 [Methylococcaceae bacterium]|nr:hypothetical protein [Methylococcaceae bacterium]
MSDLITTRAKEIVSCLVIIIFILLAFLLKSNTPAPASIDPRLSNPDLLNFLNYIDNSNENVHGAMGLTPNGHDKLKVFGKKFNEINHCYWNPGEDIKPDGKRVLKFQDNA